MKNKILNFISNNYTRFKLDVKKLLKTYFDIESDIFATWVVRSILAICFFWFLCLLFLISHLFDNPEKQETKVNAIQEVIIKNEKAVEAVGEIDIDNIIRVGFQASGEVDDIFVSEGDYVNKGQLLFKIKNTSINNDKKIAKNNLDILEYQLKLNNNINNTYSGTISKLEMEKLKNNIKNAKIALDKANDLDDKLYIRAPSDGIVVAILVEKGHIINTNFVNSQDLLLIADENKKIGVVEVSEFDINKININNKVEYKRLIDVNDDKVKACESNINFIDLISVKERKKLGDTAIYYYVKFNINDDCASKLKKGMMLVAKILY